MTDWIHPGVILIFGAFLIGLLKGKTKKVYIITLPVMALVICMLTPKGIYGQASLMGLQLVMGRVDSLSLLFAYVFCIAGFIGMVYALHVNDDIEHTAATIYLGAALGVVFAQDFITLFVFWEMIAFSAVLLVWANRSKASIQAGFRYLLVHMFGGVCLLAGILLYMQQTGSIYFEALSHIKGSWAYYLIMVGFCLNAAVPPLGAWLPDAYPNATVTGAVFMSAFTTKSAVYVLIRGFGGDEILMYAGAIMAVYGVIYATMENNGRRLLSYHIISQVGFMVCGVGIGSQMALNGASAHAFAHIIYKGLLFMAAGAVLYMTGTSKLTELGGLYKRMPFTAVFFMIGGMSIAGAPLTSGFVSKSMTITSAGLSHEMMPFLLMSLASSGTFLSICLKMAYFMFWGKELGYPSTVTEPPKNMLVAMGMASFICIFIGIVPDSLYSLLPYPTDYAPFTAQHIASALGLFLFTTLGFVIFLKKLTPKPVINLDIDWFYRKGAVLFMSFAKAVANFDYNVVGELYERAIQGLVISVSRVGKFVEQSIINPFVMAVAQLLLNLSKLFSSLHTGQVSDYAFSMCLGVILVIFALLWRFM